MQHITQCPRNYEAIKDRYFVVYMAPPILNAPGLFDSDEEAKRYLLKKINYPHSFEQLQQAIKSTGAALMILNVEQEVKRYEQEYRYGGDNFKDRQHFLDVIIFGDEDE